MRTRIWSFGFFAAMLSPTLAFATGEIVIRKTPQGTPLTKYSCGQGCFYSLAAERASEIRADQMELFRRVASETDQTAGGTWDQAWDKVDENTNGFCAAQGTTKNENTVKKCQFQWLALQGATLSNYASSIETNSAQAAALKSGKVSLDGKLAEQEPPRFPAIAGPENEGRQVISTQMETWKEIQDETLKRIVTSPAPSQMDCRKWVESVTKVYRDDFVQRREIYRDANDRARGTVKIDVYNPDGTLKYRDADYQAEVAARQGRFTDVEKKAYENFCKRYYSDYKRTAGKSSAGREAAYRSARTRIIKAAKDGIAKGLSSKDNLGGGGRLSNGERRPSGAVQSAATVATKPGRQANDPHDFNGGKTPAVGDSDEANPQFPANQGDREYFSVKYSDAALKDEAEQVVDAIKNVETYR